MSTILEQIVEKAAEYQDDETGIEDCIDLFCEAEGLDNDLAEAAKRYAFVQGALEAGIPLAVIEGREKLAMNLSDIEVTELGDIKEGPKFVDAFVQEAYWKSSGRDLTDAELDRLNENHSEFVHAQVLDYLYPFHWSSNLKEKS